MSHDSHPEPADLTGVRGPGPRTRSLVTLLLRVGLGVQLLNSGVTGFYTRRLGRQTGGTWGPSFPQSVGSTGLEGVYALLPYLEIVTALALFLGFFTIVATVAGAFQTLASQVFQAVALLTLGLANYPYRSGMEIGQALERGTTALNLLMAVLLIWLASSGDDGWSLDALVFAPRRETRSDAGRTGAEAEAEARPPRSP